jgi:hypothetical protein
MINAKLQNIIDTKSAIGNAIVNKGGTITGETPFFNYAAQIDGISTGTPQTIFAASDGSKWALTNAVNLVNDAGNVTSDFNYWQPANNSTSDPILNIGTVGANISGNIRLVPVNQVNIAQYSNIVINDTTGAKYVGYNGYDSVSNPTPTGNTTFNRWLLNNSASGTIIFANTTLTNGGTYNGPNFTTDESNITFVNNTASYGGDIFRIRTNNGFIYTAGFTNRSIQKFGESNLTRTNTSNSYGFDPFGLAVNNGFVYMAGQGNATSGRDIKKYHESNLVFDSNSAGYGDDIFTLTSNNAFLYAGGLNRVKKYHESNLVFSAQSISFGGTIRDLKTNNGFIYAVGIGNNTIQKFHESNLAFVGNTTAQTSFQLAVTTNNGFIYAGGGSGVLDKFHESNLAFVGNIVNLGTIRSLSVSNGFIYCVGATSTIRKIYESNLSILANSPDYGGLLFSVHTNDGFIYAGGQVDQTIDKYTQVGTIAETLSFFNITKIKE